MDGGLNSDSAAQQKVMQACVLTMNLQFSVLIRMQGKKNPNFLAAREKEPNPH